MDAKAVLQEYLDRLSAAVLNGDYTTYAAGVSLPFTLLTQEREISVNTESSLREGFDAYHKMLHSQLATDMIRLVDKAEYQGREWIAGRYSTNILSRSTRVFDPFNSDIFLFNRDGSWRSVWISNDMKNTDWPIHLPALKHDVYPLPDGPQQDGGANAQN